MRTTQRQPESSVVQQLIAEPQRFEFMQAIRLILQLLKRHGISDERAFAQVLRFENSTSLSFPASEIASLRCDGDLEADQLSRLRIHVTPAFIGFLGTSGILPLHYSERIAAHRKMDGSMGVQAFLDLFSNRLVAQFYLAWEKYRIERSGETRRRDRQLPILLSLAGTPEGDVETVVMDRPDTPGDYALAFYAALFRTRPASAFAIGRAMTEYFGVPIRIEEFVGAWDHVPEKMQSCLAGCGPQLAFDAMLGTRHWRYDRRICLRVGPLGEKELYRFLPRTPGAAALGKMLALFDIGCIEVEVRLGLDQECVRPLTLEPAELAPIRRLGWTTFLTTGAAPVVKPEVTYMLPLE